jgi:hypothetical protein
MKLAIMQPYFLSYIGYFQLIHAVDKYVIYDDVNYIKQGWINRNRLLLNNQEFMFTLPLYGASSFKKINEVEIDITKYKTKFLKTITQAYKKAPFFSNVFPIIETIISNTEKNLAKFLIVSLKKILFYLEITTPLLISSNIEKDNELKAQDKVIHICNKLECDTYINAIGGKNLYNTSTFLEHNISLMFLKTNPIVYKQFDNNFIPQLSIMDVMMFNSKETIKDMLDNFSFV